VKENQFTSSFRRQPCPIFGYWGLLLKKHAPKGQMFQESIKTKKPVLTTADIFSRWSSAKLKGRWMNRVDGSCLYNVNSATAVDFVIDCSSIIVVVDLLTQIVVIDFIKYVQVIMWSNLCPCLFWQGWSPLSIWALSSSAIVIIDCLMLSYIMSLSWSYTPTPSFILGSRKEAFKTTCWFPWDASCLLALNSL
jgi:hypothetical protein